MGTNLRITFENQIKTLSFHIIGSIVLFIVLLFIGFQKSDLVVFFGFWILLTLPVLILHFEYLDANKNMSIEITEDKLLVRPRSGEATSYAFDTLDKVIVYKSASMDKGGMPILPVELYHYARIIPKQGADIIITCLMTPDVEGAVSKLKFVPYERKKLLFASIGKK